MWKFVFLSPPLTPPQRAVLIKHIKSGKFDSVETKSRYFKNQNYPPNINNQFLSPIYSPYIKRKTGHTDLDQRPKLTTCVTFNSNNFNKNFEELITTANAKSLLDKLITFNVYVIYVALANKHKHL